MPTRIQLRRDTSANWAASNPVLAAGEVALSTDTVSVRVGNGTSTWSALSSFNLTVSAGFLSYTGLSSDVEILVGSGPGDLDPLPGSVGSSKTVIQAASGASLGVQRAALSTGSLSDVNTSGAVSGSLLRFNGSSWVPLTLGEMALGSQRTFQNIALRHAGYFSRGNNTTTVYKWSFPADTVSTTTAAPAGMGQRMFSLLGNHAGFANSSIAGYFARGQNLTDVYKWSFPADTVSTTTAAPAYNEINDGFSNNAVAGYINQSNGQTTVWKWTFPADTVTTTTAAPDSLRFNAGFSNQAVAGYFSRGNNTTTVYKWGFPADTVSTTTAAPASMDEHAGFDNPSIAGYFAIGRNLTDVYKWSFPADTVSTTTAAPAGMQHNAGFANPGVAGYFARGLNNTTVYKWSFPADTVSTTTSSSEVMGSNAGFANA